MTTATGYAQKVIEALYENGDPVSIDAAELLERLTENVEPEAEPEPEPVAYMDPYHGVLMWAKAPEYAEYKGVSPEEMKLLPLYTRPEPAMKPMTDEEIQKDSIFWLLYDQKSFVAGVRFAEKHHGIGGDDE